MAFRDDDSLEGAEDRDPLVRIMRMAEEEDRRRENNKGSTSSRLKSSGRKQNGGDGGSSRDQEEDPLSRIANMVHAGSDTDEVDDDDAANKEIIARIIAMKLAAEDNPQGEEEGSMSMSSDDPLSRIMQMDAEEEQERAPPRKEQKASRKNNTKAAPAPAPAPAEELTSASDQNIIKRIIAMRLAAIDAEESNDLIHSTPQDPLERIMNMNAEDQLVTAVSLMDFSNSQDENDEDENTIIRRKDFRELNKMIQNNDLEELERHAEMLASSVKSKLTASAFADLQRSHDTTSMESEPRLGYLALAMGGHKEAVNRSHVMSGLDISKISGDDESDQRFVSMSDSFLESPSRGHTSQDKPIRGILGPGLEDSGLSNDESNLLSTPPRLERMSQPASIPATTTERQENVDDDVFRNPPTSPRKKNVTLKRSSQQGDQQPNSMFVSDWWGVLGNVGSSFRSDCSDSQSSFSESFTDSVLSSEPTTSGRVATLASPSKKASDERRVVPTAVIQATMSKTAQGTKVSGLSTIEEKLQARNDAVAWKSSLAKSFLKNGG